MKTVVLGKVIETDWMVNLNTKTIQEENGDEKVVYTGKPVLVDVPKVKEWKEICSFKGSHKYNSYSSSLWAYSYVREINISENESVGIESEIFRADLNEMHLRTYKVLEKIDVNKEKAEVEYNGHVRAFNRMMIESNQNMKDYCDLHHLDYEESDCEKVFSIVYPGKEYEIKDGKMKEKVITYTTTSIGDYCTIKFDNGSCISTAISAADIKRSVADATYSTLSEAISEAIAKN